MVKQAIGTLGIALALPAFAQSTETELAKLDPDVAAKLTGGTITLIGDFKTDAVYNIICKRAGLDVIFDPSFEAQKVWVDFGGQFFQGRLLPGRGLPLLDALEIVRRQSHTAWRVVTPHTIVVVRVPSQSPRPNPPKMSDPLKLTPTDRV